jgi:non-specific serine/threonine protein kinase
MGVVHLARDPQLNRPVAIKILSDDWTEEEVSRFEREARTAAQLNHPNVATIYHLGRTEQTPFIAMEYIQGTTLQDRLRSSERLPISDVLDIAIQVAEGLSAAHERKIVHRDLKPQNVMLTHDDRVKILDFGLAKPVAPAPAPGATTDDTSQLTAEHRLLGTPGYMSPEQVRGRGVDERTDVFSLGIMLYEMATGVRPFRGETDADVLTAILRDSPADITGLTPACPRELDRIIGKCLAKDAQDRYQSASDLLADLRRVPSAAPPEPQRVPSVAVLPFANLSADPENEYFTDGMAEEIINALSKVQGLRVASRTSAFSFKGRQEDIRRIGEQLGVQSVLEGSIRKAGNRLRVTVQLVNAADGYQIWSDRYDRDLEDVFAVQDEIAANITQALQVVLTDRERRALEKASTTDVDAYDYYLRGRQFFHQFRRKGWEFALQMFQRAIEIDPGYALACAGIANCHSQLYNFSGARQEDLRLADEASQRALELDPELAEAHAARGLALSQMGRFDEAREAFNTAIRLAPQLVDAYLFYARACFEAGKLEEAAGLLEQARRVRPEIYQTMSLLGMVYAALGRTDESVATNREALEVIDKRLQLNPDDSRAVYQGAVALARLGELRAAREWAERALRMDPEEAPILYNVACAYAVLNETDKALDLLERMGEKLLGYREWIEQDSDFDAMRSHPRFKALLESLRAAS